MTSVVRGIVLGDGLSHICDSKIVSISVLQCGTRKERLARVCFADDRDAINYVRCQIKTLRTRAAV